MVVVDRKNYVMSVEVAIAREMAYRNKLQCSNSINDTTKDLIHSQVATSSPYIPPTHGLMQNQRPGMPPGSMLSPFHRPNTGPTPTWTPVLSSDQISVSTSMWRPVNPADLKKKAPINPNKPVPLGSFFCLLCQIDCTTSHNLMMHYQGQRHRAKLNGEPKGKNTVPGGSSLTTAKDRLYCKLCGIWCKDEFTYRFHLQCKNHILTLQEHEKRMKKP